MNNQQHTSPFVVNHEGRTLVLNRIDFGLSSKGHQYNEAWLQNLLHNNPQSLPTEEIDTAYKNLVPVCTELSTPAGPIDNLFVTPEGKLVVLEAKLWRNPEARRKVIGQILDYAKEHYDYVLVDTAPVGVVTDTLLLSHNNADLFIYVVRANYLDKRFLTIPKKLHSEKRLSNMAVVMNGTDQEKGYGYGYGYGVYGNTYHEKDNSSLLKRIKNFLRESNITSHWKLGFEFPEMDTYRKLTHSIQCAPSNLFSEILNWEIPMHVSSFGLKWKKVDYINKDKLPAFFEAAPYSDLSVFELLLDFVHRLFS